MFKSTQRQAPALAALTVSCDTGRACARRADCHPKWRRLAQPNRTAKTSHRRGATTAGQRTRVPYWARVCVMLVVVVAAAASLAHAVNPVLDIKNTFPYLIDNVTGGVIEPRDYMDFDNIYTPSEAYKRHQTAQGRNYYLIKAFDFANYFQSDYWNYSSEHDLRRSAEPVANESACAHQLNWLDQQLARADKTLFERGEQHLQLMTLADSFGHTESNTYYGHAYWLGSYHECTKTTLDTRHYAHEECVASERASGATTSACAKPAGPAPPHTHIKFRYCIGKAHDIDWPQDDNYVPRVSYKIGLCLPETCETLSFARHAHTIERLMRLNLADYTKRRIRLHDMYCLPDARSPIRALTPQARVMLSLCAGWLCLLAAATLLHSCYKRHQKDLQLIYDSEQVCDAAALRLRLHCAKLPVAAPAVVITRPHKQHNSPFGDSQPRDSQPSNSYCRATQQVHKQHGHAQSELPFGATGDKQGREREHSCNRDDDDDDDDKSSECDLCEQGLVASCLCLDSQASSPVELAKAMAAQCNGAKSAAASCGATRCCLSGTSRRDLDTTSGDKPMASAALAAAAAAAAASALGANQTKLRQQQQLMRASSVSVAASLSNWLAESPNVIKYLRALSITETLGEFIEPPKLLQTNGHEVRVNLNAMDAIKCLCCLLVIFGHIVLIHMMHLSNIIHTIELSHEIYPRLLIAFFNFVDTFFIISGLLTAYFIFKRYNERTFASPLVWAHVSLFRLLRLSPVYVLVFWYIKTLSVHLTDGPIWDYGTDKNSIRGLCINDHWWKSLLYLGNYGTMQPLCILPAWSIIVDAQYSLIVPPILYLIFKHKRLAYVALLVATIVSTSRMSHQLANQTAVETSDMAKVRLHVYPLISRFAAEFYNNAWNRIGPVAVGIIGGHVLYQYELGIIKQWPWFMRGVVFKIVLFLHLFILVLPTIGRYTDDPQTNAETDTTIFILSNATIKPIWSVINTILLLRLITDLRSQSVLARLMSHNLWHCIGKLCFTSYLIHYEIIVTMLKSRHEGLLSPTWANAWREFSAVFLISTILSYFIYILYEAPVNKLISLMFVRKPAQSPPAAGDKSGHVGQGQQQLQTNHTSKLHSTRNSTTNKMLASPSDNDDEDYELANTRLTISIKR